MQFLYQLGTQFAKTDMIRDMIESSGVIGLIKIFDSKKEFINIIFVLLTVH